MGKMRPTGSDEKLFIFAGMHCENIDEKNWAIFHGVHFKEIDKT